MLFREPLRTKDQIDEITGEPDNTAELNSIPDMDIVEIKFKDLVPDEFRCRGRLMNLMRRTFEGTDAVFEPGVEMTIFARSGDKDKDGIPYIVVNVGKRTEYVSENDLAADSTMLSDDEKLQIAKNVLNGNPKLVSDEDKLKLISNAVRKRLMEKLKYRY